LRDQALLSVEQGRFDVAYEHLVAARRLDREAGLEADRIRLSRRISEAETVLSTARLAALRANYGEAFSLCLEAREVLGDASPELEGRILTTAAHFLNAECHEVGSEGVIERNISRAEETLSAAAAGCATSTYLTVLLEIADLYALLGYRRGENRVLHEATRQFRRIWLEMPPDAPGELRLRTAISLGDTHAEIGLNRNSRWQAHIGIEIMRRALSCSSIEVGPAERANALVRLGTAQANAGLMSGGPEYDDSVASYEAAMELIRGLNESLTMARAWWGLAIAFLGQGKAKRSTAILKRSEACCNEALKVFTRDKYPIDWATNIQNRGNAKLERGLLENGTATLFEAIDDFEQAALVRTRRRFPLGHAKSLGNMAIAKRVAAERLGDMKLARQAEVDIAESIAALKGGSEDYWRTYYGAELKKIEDLVGRLRAREHAAG
jgi:tetratricopeptide (TPR) repeat protein